MLTLASGFSLLLGLTNSRAFYVTSTPGCGSLVGSHQGRNQQEAFSSFGAILSMTNRAEICPLNTTTPVDRGRDSQDTGLNTCPTTSKFLLPAAGFLQPSRLHPQKACHGDKSHHRDPKALRSRL